MMTAAPSLVSIRPGRPFYGMVNTFMASAVGLGPFFDPVHPQKPSQASTVFYGFFNPMSAKEMYQVVCDSLARSMTPAEALNTLCGMLAMSTYRIAKSHVDSSPEFEVLDLLRDAAAHGNKFSFKGDEPKRPVAWRTFRLDATKKGSMNPLHGKACFGTVFGPADLLLLLSDIDKKLP